MITSSWHSFQKTWTRVIHLQQDVLKSWPPYNSTLSTKKVFDLYIANLTKRKHVFEQPEIKALYHVSDHTEHCFVSPLSVKWLYSSSRRGKMLRAQNIPPQANIKASSDLSSAQSCTMCVCARLSLSVCEFRCSCSAVDVYKWVAPKPSDSNASPLAGTPQRKPASEQQSVCA